jgi:hypothetical protein
LQQWLLACTLCCCTLFSGASPSFRLLDFVLRHLRLFTHWHLRHLYDFIFLALAPASRRIFRIFGASGVRDLGGAGRVREWESLGATTATPLLCHFVVRFGSVVRSRPRFVRPIRRRSHVSFTLSLWVNQTPPRGLWPIQSLNVTWSRELCTCMRSYPSFRSWLIKKLWKTSLLTHW